jgi:DnaK suppressor protein
LASRAALVITAERDAVMSLLDLTSSDVRPVDVGLPIGRLSRVDAMQMQGMAQLNRRQLEFRRERIKVALAAPDDGSYGSCRACRGILDLARLEAHPDVPFCLACLESFESGE